MEVEDDGVVLSCRCDDETWFLPNVVVVRLGESSGWV